MKKKILFVYDKMMIGGTTTSLLSLLNEISLEDYDIDLLLFYPGGAIEYMIPEHVNVMYVPSKDISRSKIALFFRFLFSRNFIWYLSSMFSKKTSSRMLLWQFTNSIKGQMTQIVDGEYDYAIGFMEGWSNAYVVSPRLKTKNRICWVHLDYKNSYLVPESYRGIYEKASSVVLVSQRCLDNFREYYPDLAQKACCIENILSQKVVIKRADEVPSDFMKIPGRVCFMSVCRIVFSHKGLDRAINAFARLKSEGFDNFSWHIIGAGQDEAVMRAMICDKGLEDHVFIMGIRKNPLPYVRQSDAFLLPSRYEGKPMAVTEALMLGKPCIVCDYASAREQIDDKITGLIARNDDFDIYNVLKEVLSSPDIISKLSQNVKQIDFSNREEIEKIYGLFQ